MSSGLVTVSTTTTQRRSARSTRRLRQAAVESSTTTIPETTNTTTTTTPTTTNDHESKPTTTSSPSVSVTTTATPTATTTTTNGNGAVRPSDARPSNTPKNTTAKSTTKSTSATASTSTSRSPNNSNNNSGARPAKPVATPSSATAVPATSAPKPSSVWDRRKLAKAATTPTNATTASKSKPPPKPQPPKQPSRAPSQQQPPSRASAPPSGLAAKSRTGGFRANRTAHRFDSNAAPAPPAASATFSAGRGGGTGGATGKKEDFPSLQGGGGGGSGGGSGAGGDKPKPASSATTTTTANANANAQTSALRRSGRSGGYQAPRTSHSYDADAVDMTRAAPARPDRIMEQRPAASPTRTRPERAPERETTAIERPAAPPQTRESGLRREPVNSGDAGGSGGGSRGLSTRSSGFKPRRVTSESAARPSNDVISKLAETFGKGRRKYVPPAIRDVVAAAVTIDSDDDDTPPKREPKPKPKPAPKTTKSSAAAVASKPATKPATKSVAKPISKSTVKTPTHSRTRATGKVSPAKSVHSTTSSSSSSSSPKSAHTRIAKKKKQPFTISGESTKYLEHRQNPHSLASVAIISRDSKSLHDVTSIKTELERKIAATDQEVGNDYYYNKADMVEAVRTVEFDTTIEVTDDAQKIRSNADEWRPQGPADMATAAALMQGVTVGVGDVYAQDGLATHAHAHAHAMHGYMADPMQPTHGPNMAHAQMAYTEESSPMAPTHSPGLEQQQHQLMLLQQQQMEMFAAGMMPNVPVVTDLREIQKNAAIAMESNLSAMVTEFVPCVGDVSGPVSADGMVFQQQPQQMLNQPQFAFNGSFISQQIQNTIPPVNAMNAAFILPANAATGAVGNPQATAWMQPQNPAVNVEQIAQQQQLQPQQQQQQLQPPPQQQQQLPQAVDGIHGNVGFHAHPQPPPPQQAQQNHNYGFQGYQQPVPQNPQQQQQQRRNRTWNDNNTNNDRNYVSNRSYNTNRGGGRGTYRGGRGGGNNRYRDYNRNSNNRYQNQYQNSNQTQNQNDNTENATFQQQQQGAPQQQQPQQQQPQQQQMSQQQQPQRGGRGGYQNRNWNQQNRDRGGYNHNQNQNYRERNFNNNSNGRYGNNNNRRYQRYDAQQQQQPQQGQGQGQYPQQQGQYQGGQNRRERSQKMVDNQSNRYKEYLRETKTTAPAKKYDAKVLPAWCGAEKIEDLFRVIAQDADADTADADAGGEEVIVNTQLLDASLYLNFLCDDAVDGVSDAVFEFLGLGEIVRSLLPAANHRLKRRIYESAPVFASLSICDATIEMDALNVALSPDSFAGVFRYRNPHGLREFRLGQRQSLASVPWPQLQSYLEQCPRLSRIIVGDRASGSSQEPEQQQSEPTVAQMDGVMQLLSSLVGAQTLIVEQAPFLVDAPFILSLPSVICDLRLFDAHIAWSEAFVTAIRNHFGRISRLGLPANCLDMPTLVSVVEGLTEELLLRNVHPTAASLQKQDLLLLFCRFARLEFDASVVAAYPNAAKCKTTKCHTLCVSADTPNFFIPLLMALPWSVTHLAVKNPTGSTNNLHFDAEQLRQQKYKTEHVRALTLFGFDNNLKQVANLVNRRLFPALQQLTLVTANINSSSETIEGDLRKLLKRDIIMGDDDDDDDDKDKPKKSKTKQKKSKQLEIAAICNTDPYFVLA